MEAAPPNPVGAVMEFWIVLGIACYFIYAMISMLNRAANWVTGDSNREAAARMGYKIARKWF